MSLLDRGSHEGLKGAVHAGIFTLAAISAGYNLACLVRRPRFYLFMNAMIYGTIVGYEIATVRRHWGCEDD